MYSTPWPHGASPQTAERKKADVEQKLREEDVARLLANPSADTRAEIAVKIAGQHPALSSEQRKLADVGPIEASSFRGSGAVVNPEAEMVPNRKNKDFFLNLKAQSWWALRMRFQQTYRAVAEGQKVDPDSIISISSSIKHLTALSMELSQPTYSITEVGKVRIDKQPHGAKSPNLADAVMIAFHPDERKRRSFFG